MPQGTGSPHPNGRGRFWEIVGRIPGEFDVRVADDITTLQIADGQTFSLDRQEIVDDDLLDYIESEVTSAPREQPRRSASPTERPGFERANEDAFRYLPPTAGPGWDYHYYG